MNFQLNDSRLSEVNDWALSFARSSNLGFNRIQINASFVKVQKTLAAGGGAWQMMSGSSNTIDNHIWYLGNFHFNYYLSVFTSGVVDRSASWKIAKDNTNFSSLGIEGIQRSAIAAVENPYDSPNCLKRHDNVFVNDVQIAGFNGVGNLDMSLFFQGLQLIFS
jgi:hypothetical protein